MSRETLFGELPEPDRVEREGRVTRDFVSRYAIRWYPGDGFGGALLPSEHRARVIWAYVEKLDLSALEQAVPRVRMVRASRGQVRGSRLPNGCTRQAKGSAAPGRLPTCARGPVNLLYRKQKAHYVQEGHTQRVQIDAKIGRLRAKILHDDRKSFSKGLQAQDRYMRLEAQHILRSKWSEFRTRGQGEKRADVRTFCRVLYCYFGKLLVMDGSYGLFYAFQRMLAETLLSLRLIELAWDKHASKPPSRQTEFAK